MSDPREAYSRLLDQRRAEIALREERHRVFGYGRLAAVVAAVAIVWLALAENALSIAWTLAPVAVFVALMVVHDRLLQKLARRRRAAAFFERALARLDGHWPGTGEAGDCYLTAEHPYAADLDLFGKGSLFELLCTARTHIGEDTLARWLMAPAAPAVARARQEAVIELRPRVDLREDLAVAGEEARTGVDPVSLAAWGEAPAAMQDRRLRVTMVALTVLGAVGAVALFTWIFGVVRAYQLPASLEALSRDVAVVVFLGNWLFLRRRRKQTDAVVTAVEQAAHELGLLSEVLVRLERELAALGVRGVRCCGNRSTPRASRRPSESHG